MGVNRAHPMTLCWGCQNTNRHKCSWFDPDNQQPVPGWTAEKDYRNGVGDTYHVTACPNFLPGDQPAGVNQPSTPGVYYRPDLGNWCATIYRNNRSYWLGSFDRQQDAIAARRAAEEAFARGEEPRRNIRR